MNKEMIKHILKKPYPWGFLAALCNAAVLMCWLCGAELSGIVIFCVIASAIVGNYNAAITSLRSELYPIALLRKQIMDIIEEVPDEEDNEAPNK